MLWDGRMHRDFVAGMQRFGASNGKAQKTAKELMKAITEHKIKLVDERHKIKHTRKPKNPGWQWKSAHYGRRQTRQTEKEGTQQREAQNKG